MQNHLLQFVPSATRDGMVINMDIGYITDYGNVRTENQDRFLVLEKQEDFGEVTLCVVADGMGGTMDGSLASDMTVRRIQTWWQEELPEYLPQQAVHAYVSESLDVLVYECNQEILHKAVERHISTGTTLSLMFTCKEQALIKHIGDSRIYLERNGEWTQLTRDHTWEQQELDQGVDPRADADYKKKKGALTNALGARENCRVDTQILQMVKGDRYLLCSDGFYRYIDPKQQMQEFERAQSLLEKKAEQIRKTSAVDNFTAVLAVNGGLERTSHEMKTVLLI